MLSYKGFVAQLDYESETDCIIGEVVNAPDVLIFEGQNLPQLKARFYALVDEYLQFCVQEKSSVNPFVGRITVCLEPAIQQAVIAAAEREAVGVQHWLSRELQIMLQKRCLNKKIA